MEIIAIIGKSGSGKSTVIGELESYFGRECKVIKSYTTRKVRKEDPNDYNTHIFVDDEFFASFDKERIVSLYNSPKGYVSWASDDLFSKHRMNLYAIDPVAVKKELEPYCIKNNIEYKIIYIRCDESVRKRRYVMREKTLRKFSNEKHLDFKHLNGCENVYVVDGNKGKRDVFEQVLNILEK